MRKNSKQNKRKSKINSDSFDEFLAKVKIVEAGPLRGEFEWANALCGTNGGEHKNAPNVADEWLMIEEYTKRGRIAWVETQGEEESLSVMRKLAAMPLLCPANHDFSEQK